MKKSEENGNNAENREGKTTKGNPLIYILREISKNIDTSKICIKITNKIYWKLKI